MNASDMRSKRRLGEALGAVVCSRTLSDFFGEPHDRFFKAQIPLGPSLHAWPVSYPNMSVANCSHFSS